jgi:hypothetical protein
LSPCTLACAYGRASFWSRSPSVAARRRCRAGLAGAREPQPAAWRGVSLPTRAASQALSLRTQADSRALDFRTAAERVPMVKRVVLPPRRVRTSVAPTPAVRCAPIPRGAEARAVVWASGVTRATCRPHGAAVAAGGRARSDGSVLAAFPRQSTDRLPRTCAAAIAANLPRPVPRPAILRRRLRTPRRATERRRPRRLPIAGLDLRRQPRLPHLSEWSSIWRVGTMRLLRRGEATGSGSGAARRPSWFADSRSSRSRARLCWAQTISLSVRRPPRAAGDICSRDPAVLSQ